MNTKGLCMNYRYSTILSITLALAGVVFASEDKSKTKEPVKKENIQVMANDLHTCLNIYCAKTFLGRTSRPRLFLVQITGDFKTVAKREIVPVRFVKELIFLDVEAERI